ncbi:MAG: protease complex subunit PrcB family protein [Bacillota bacterium]
MRYLARATLFLLAAMLLTACARNSDSIPFVTVAQGDQTGIREDEVLLFTEPEAWEAHWRSHAAVNPEPARPPVDFSTESVLAIYLGEKSTTGHAVEVTRIARGDDRLKVAVKMTFPGRRNGAGISRAFHIVRFPKVPPDTVLEVTWR